MLQDITFWQISFSVLYVSGAIASFVVLWREAVRDSIKHRKFPEPEEGDRYLCLVLALLWPIVALLMVAYVLGRSVFGGYFGPMDEEGK